MTANNRTYTPTILFVDDEPSVLKSLGRFSRGKPWTAQFAGSGSEGLAFLKKARADIVVSDMRMPRMSGTEFLTQVRERYPETILISLTGYTDMETLEATINQAKIYNYITKPWDEASLNDVLDRAIHEQLSRYKLKVEQESTEYQKRKLGKVALFLDKQVKEKDMETEQALNLLASISECAQHKTKELLKVLVQLINWQEGKRSGHSQFVAEYSVKVARALNLAEEEVECIHITSMLQNVGLLGLPDEIRKKPVFELNEHELVLYRQHCAMAETVLERVPELSSVAKIIRSHHEYIDGTGFPDNLVHRNIPLQSRIINVVSDYYEIFHGWLEEKSSGKEDARQFLLEYSGKRYDSGVVKTFLDLLDESSKHLVSQELKNASMLKPGMVLEDEVITSHGVMLLVKGTQLSEATIEKLIKYEENVNVKFKIRVNKPNQNCQVEGVTP